MKKPTKRAISRTKRMRHECGNRGIPIETSEESGMAVMASTAYLVADAMLAAREHKGDAK